METRLELKWPYSVNYTIYGKISLNYVRLESRLSIMQSLVYDTPAVSVRILGMSTITFDVPEPECIKGGQDLNFVKSKQNNEVLKTGRSLFNTYWDTIKDSPT